MNFGCGTLIALVLLVVAAGKLIPHGSTKPSPPQASPGGIKGQGSGVDRGSFVKLPAKALEEPQGPSFEAMLAELKKWLDEKALEAEHHVLDRAVLPAGPTAEVFAEVGEQAKALVTQKIAEVSSPSVPPPQTFPAEKTLPKSATSRTSPATPVTPLSSGAKLAVEGRDPVFNNPWNRAVEPVERYLKQHVHDAASIEVLEWGQVEVTREGYQARCVYKSKNVLGKMTTQRRLFVLDHSGKVIDIRD